MAYLLWNLGGRVSPIGRGYPYISSLPIRLSQVHRMYEWSRDRAVLCSWDGVGSRLACLQSWIYFTLRHRHHSSHPVSLSAFPFDCIHSFVDQFCAKIQNKLETLVQGKLVLVICLVPKSKNVCKPCTLISYEGINAPKLINVHIGIKSYYVTFCS